jgi:hypothetical protein
MSIICTPKVTQMNLVNTTSDPSLINAWGIIVHDNYMWVTSNGTDLLIRYDLNGSNPLDTLFYDESGVLLQS